MSSSKAENGSFTKQQYISELFDSIFFICFCVNGFSILLMAISGGNQHTPTANSNEYYTIISLKKENK